MLSAQNIYDVIIIGGGVAGLSAALYSGRYHLRTIVLEGRSPGGETAVAWMIENYPGVPKIDGYDLVIAMREQATAVGSVLLPSEASAVVQAEHCFTVVANDGQEYYGKTLIFAHGSRRRRLGLVGESQLTGHGISYCGTCDAPLYKGKRVGIVGSGDAAVKAAELAATYAEQVFIFAREDALHAEPTNQEGLKKFTNIEVIYQTEVFELLGQNQLEAVKLTRAYQGNVVFPLDGLFIEIGAEPLSDLPRSLGVTLDNHGYIEVDPMMKTNLDGVYAAGDITNETGSFKQDVVAAAQGAVAATSAYRDLGQHGSEVCLVHALPVVKSE